MNIVGKKAEEMLKNFDREKKIQLCQQQKARLEGSKKEVVQVLIALILSFFRHQHIIVL